MVSVKYWPQTLNLLRSKKLCTNFLNAISTSRLSHSLSHALTTGTCGHICRSGSLSAAQACGSIHSGFKYWSTVEATPYTSDANIVHNNTNVDAVSNKIIQLVFVSRLCVLCITELTKHNDIYCKATAARIVYFRFSYVPIIKISFSSFLYHSTR